MTPPITGDFVLVVDAYAIDDFVLIAQIDFTTVTFVVHFTGSSLLSRPEYQVLFPHDGMKHPTFPPSGRIVTEQLPNCIRENFRVCFCSTDHFIRISFVRAQGIAKFSLKSEPTSSLRSRIEHWLDF
jgi:hypothetical protein